MYTKLEDIRRQCNLDSNEDDELLVSYAEAAEDFIEKRINCTLEELETDEGKIPTPLNIAILMLCAQFYREREAVSNLAQYRVPYGLEALITPYKKII